MKRIKEMIVPTFGGDSLVSFMWRERRYRVREILETWRADSKWWLDKERTGIKRKYFRLIATGPGGNEVTVEIMRETLPEDAEPLWTLEKMLD